MAYSKKNIIFFAYIFTLHLLILFLISKTYTFKVFLEEIGFDKKEHNESQFYLSTLAHQLRIDGTSNEQSFVFFGDSLTQGLNTSAIINRSENYGIGFDTSAGLLERFSHYRSGRHSRNIFICIGTNDIGKIPPEEIINNIIKIINLIPKQNSVFVSGLLPISEKRDQKFKHLQLINRTNLLLENILNNHSNVQYIPPPNKLKDTNGFLINYLHEGDGLHLNSKGYSVWINYLRKELLHNER